MCYEIRLILQTVPGISLTPTSTTMRVKGDLIGATLPHLTTIVFIQITGFDGRVECGDGE